jgi:cell division septation protein DedD
LGSGLNLKKDEIKAPAASTPATPAKSAERFVVQVASYREKKDADAALEKLSAKGLAAYVTEVHSAEKGVWFRVRIGKHLTREEADDLAETAGQGAIVTAE